MEHGGGELPEGGDGLAGAEDVSEEARAGRAGVLEDFREEIEGGAANAFDRDFAGEELFDVRAVDVFWVGADGGESLEVVGGEVREGVREGTEVFGGESERSLHRSSLAILMDLMHGGIRCPKARHRGHLANAE